MWQCALFSRRCELVTDYMLFYTQMCYKMLAVARVALRMSRRLRISIGYVQFPRGYVGTPTCLPCTTHCTQALHQAVLFS